MTFQKARLNFLLGIMTILVVSLGVGCKPSGGGQPSASPTPSSNAKATPAMPERGITGHTEDKNGNPNKDDFPNCFLQDDSRDLVLTVTAPEITPNNVTMVLWKVPTQTVIFPLPPKIKNGSAEFRFRDEGTPVAGAKKLALPPQHLGPGPYVATATIATVNPAERPRIRTQALTFGYDTYQQGPSECRSF